jgi:hypothetical protein
MSKEVHTNDGELDPGQQERPLETAAVKNESHLSLTPARNVQSICPREARAGLLSRG